MFPSGLGDATKRPTHPPFPGAHHQGGASGCDLGQPLLAPNPSPKQELTAAWAQDNYICDSGINTAGTSAEASVYSTGSTMRNDLVYGSETCSNYSLCDDFNNMTTHFSTGPPSATGREDEGPGFVPEAIGEALFPDDITFMGDVMKDGPFAPQSSQSFYGQSGSSSGPGPSPAGPDPYGGQGGSFGQQPGPSQQSQQLPPPYELTQLQSPMSVEMQQAPELQQGGPYTPGGMMQGAAYPSTGGPSRGEESGYESQHSMVQGHMAPLRQQGPPYQQSAGGQGMGPQMGGPGYHARVPQHVLQQQHRGGGPPPHGVVEAAATRDDAQVMEKALPEIIRWLEDADPVVVKKSVGVLREISSPSSTTHPGGYQRAMLQSDQLVGALLRAAERAKGWDDDFKLLIMILRTLYNMTSLEEGQEGARKIHQAGGAMILVSFLDPNLIQQNEKIMFITIPLLNNMLLKGDRETKQSIRLAGGIQRMVPLLQNQTNPKFLAILIHCLWLICDHHDESKLMILTYGGVEILLNILRMPAEIFGNPQELDKSCCKLLYRIFDALKTLSACQQIKKAIVNADAIPTLNMHLQGQNVSFALSSLYILLNISDEATRAANVEPLLSSLVRILTNTESLPPKHSIDIVMKATGILCNLTCNNAANKLTVCNEQGVPALVEVVTRCVYGRRLEMAELATSVLRNLAWGHDQTDNARLHIFQCGMIQQVVGILDLPHHLTQPEHLRLAGPARAGPMPTGPPPPGPANMPPLQPDTLWPLVKATLCLMRSMVQNQHAKCQFRDCGGIDKLVRLFATSHQMHIQLGGRSEEYGGGVRVEEIRDFTQKVLKALSSEPENKLLIEQMCPIALQD